MAKITIRIPCDSEQATYASLGSSVYMRLASQRPMIRLKDATPLTCGQSHSVEEGKVIEIFRSPDRVCLYKVRRGAKSRINGNEVKNLEEVGCYRIGGTSKASLKRVKSKLCPPFSPCKFSRARWARAAKAVMDTIRTDKEHGYMICEGKDGAPRVYKYCQGDTCYLTGLELCRTPLKTVGMFHTHPAPKRKEIKGQILVFPGAQDSWKRKEVAFSAGDFVHAIHAGEKFMCVLDKTGLGECVILKDELVGHPERMPEWLRRASPHVTVSEREADEVIKARCKLDLSSEGKEEVWFKCEGSK